MGSSRGLIIVVITLLSYLAGTKSVFVRPPVRTGYDDNYRSRNYWFVEWQNYLLVACSVTRTFRQLRLFNTLIVYIDVAQECGDYISMVTIFDPLGPP